MARIADASQGFVYLVSVTGVTGARGEVSTRVQSLIQAVKAQTDKAVNVGFGVSSAEQAKQIQSWGADGVIVGSALVKELGSAPTAGEGVARMKALAQELRSALG